VVAINNDPDAGIFRVCDFGIVGDIFELLPVLIEKLRERKTANVKGGS
jgi:electron transfer flavoprotein alpha subunit